MSEKKKVTPYSRGKSDRLRRKTKSENPYTVAIERAGWVRGWNSVDSNIARVEKEGFIRVKKNPMPNDDIKQYVVYQVFSGGIENRISGFSSKLQAINFAKNMKASGKKFHVRPVTRDSILAVVWPTQKTKKNPIIPGITARPITGKRRLVFAVEYASKKEGPWNSAGIFPNRTLADDYAKSMHEVNPSKYWRVATK